MRSADMKTLRFVTLATASLLLAACQAKTDAAGAADDPANKPVATVAGKPITQGVFDTYVKSATGRSVADLEPELKQRALDSLISMHVLSAQAEKDGLDKEADMASRLQLDRMNMLQQALAEKYLKDKTPTEQELRAEYDTQVAQLSRNEYRARRSRPPRSSSVCARARSSRPWPKIRSMPRVIAVAISAGSARAAW